MPGLYGDGVILVKLGGPGGGLGGNVFENTDPELVLAGAPKGEAVEGLGLENAEKTDFGSLLGCPNALPPP